MTLVRANPQAVVAECKPLFLIGRDDFVQFFARDEHSVLATRGKQAIDIDPARGVQLQSDLFRLMAQDEAQELARPRSLFLVHNSKLNPRFLSAEYLRVSNRKSCAGR